MLIQRDKILLSPQQQANPFNKKNVTFTHLFFLTFIFKTAPIILSDFNIDHIDSLVNTDFWHQEITHRYQVMTELHIPSRKLTYPTLKGKPSSIVPWEKDMLVP